MIVYGLAGPAGAGKSTIAEYLVKEHGAKRYSLAASLKEMLRLAFEFSHEQVYGTQAQKEAIDPRYGFSFRWAAQRVGTQGMRAVYGPDFFAKHVVKTMLDERPAIAVIDDVRFINEANILRHDAPVKRGDAVKIITLYPPDWAGVGEDAHASESEWVRINCDNVVRPSAYGVEELIATFKAEVMP